MLHYPRLNIPESKYSWIYSLAIELEPKAKIYWYEDQKKDIQSSWEQRLMGKKLTDSHEAIELEKMSKSMLKQFPLMHCFFFYLVDAYLMQNRLQYAAKIVHYRTNQIINNPYKVVNSEFLEYGIDHKKTTYGKYCYNPEMQDWIGALRTLQFFEIDIQNKIDTGFVFKPRPKSRSNPKI